MIRGLAGVLTALTLGIGSAHAAIVTSTSNAIHLSGISSKVIQQRYELR